MNNPTTPPTPEQIAAALEIIDHYAAKVMTPEKAAEFCSIVRKDANVAVAMADYFKGIEAGVKEFGPEACAEALERVWQKHGRISGDQQSLSE